MVNFFAVETGINITRDDYGDAYDFICDEMTKVAVILEYCHNYREANETKLDYAWMKCLLEFRYAINNKLGSKLKAAYCKLSSYPPNYLIELELGNYYSYIEAFNKAEHHFNKAILEIPKAADAYYMLGIVKYRQDLHAESMENSRKAMEFSKNSEAPIERKARAMHNFGVSLYLHEHDLERAIDYIKSAIFIFPDYPIAKSTLISFENLRKTSVTTHKVKSTVSSETKNRSQKVFAPLVTLSECLLKYTNDELRQICNRWGIKGISKLRKHEIVEILCDKLPDCLSGYMDLFPTSQLEVFYRMARQGGITDDKCDDLNTDFFCDIGFLNHNKTSTFQMQMPVEIIGKCLQHERSPKSAELGRKNQEYVTFARGLLVHYGMLSVDDFTSIVSGYDVIKSKTDNFMNVALTYFATGKICYMMQDYIIYRNVRNPYQILRIHELNRDFPYTPISYERVMKAGKKLKVPLNTQQSEIFDSLYDELFFDDDEVDNIQRMLLAAIENQYSTMDSLAAIGREYDFYEELYTKNDLELIKNLKKCTGIYAYKGYTDSEVVLTSRGQLQKAKSKVSRNHPCPCGSGKKYKKCCG